MMEAGNESQTVEPRTNLHLRTLIGTYRRYAGTQVVLNVGPHVVEHA
jgi:hypothetical protein